MEPDDRHYETDGLREYAYAHADDPLDWREIDRMARDIQDRIHSDYNPAPLDADGQRWHVGDTTMGGDMVIGIGLDALFLGRYEKAGTFSNPKPVLTSIAMASETTHFGRLSPAERIRRIADQLRDGVSGRSRADDLTDIAREIEGDEE